MHRLSAKLAVTVAALLFIAWMLVNGSTEKHELLVGALATVAASLFVLQVSCHEELRLHFRFKDIAQARHIPWNILSGGLQISWLLIKDFAGKPAGSFYRSCGFPSGTHDPQALARTTLATLYTTASPNSIVIGIDPEQSLMLFHQVKREPVHPITRALGAQDFGASDSGARS